MPTISLFPHIKDTKQATDLPIDLLFTKIQNGFWQDLIIPLRTKSKAERTEIKKSLPYVTVSGRFSTRNNEGLIEHSGLIAMDIDNADPGETKRLLRRDRYCLSAFTSCSGTGACAIFKIDPAKQLEAFDGLAAYLFQTYKIVVDQNCKDVSRPRFVSYDPDIYINDHAATFKQYLKKSKPEPRKDIIYIQSDFEAILEQLSTIDITDSYREWLRIGFAIADKFKEDGRQIYHLISKNNPTYSIKATDKQFDACLAANNTGVTISTFYWICRQHNISTISERSLSIAKLAASHKKARSTLEQSIKTIKEFYDQDCEDIVTQVFQKDVDIPDVSEIEAGRIWIRNHNLRRNLLTGQIETTHPLTNQELAGLELKMREDLPDLDKSDIALLLNSDAVPGFHEIFDFFKKYEHINNPGSIKRLANSLNTSNPEFTEKMLTKWLVGGISCLYGEESHTMLVLCGEKHGTGKSYFFKNLLPLELSTHSVCKDFSLLGSDGFKKDFEITITRNWLVWDDEMGGKSKRDHRIIKAMLSKSFTNERAAYDRTEQRRKRISFFGATSNDLDIVPDFGDNRRIIPIQILGIDHEAKDRVDPVDYMMEAYHLYHEGYNHRVLGEDIVYLNENTEKFKETSTESEMIQQFYKPGNCYMTITEIKNNLSLHTKDRLNNNRLVSAIRELGVEQEHRRVGNVLGRYYALCAINSTTINLPNPF